MRGSLGKKTINPFSVKEVQSTQDSIEIKIQHYIQAMEIIAEDLKGILSKSGLIIWFIGSMVGRRKFRPSAQ
jgi:hypothetical protein